MEKKNIIISNVSLPYITILDYSRDILIKEKVYISDYDIIYLTGMNIGAYLLELSKSLCNQCGKTCSQSDILTMKCQCQFCKECLTSNLQSSTNGEMLLNKFEKNYGEKFGCLCKNVFDPEEAFRQLSSVLFFVPLYYLCLIFHKSQIPWTNCKAIKGRDCFVGQ